MIYQEDRLLAVFPAELMDNILYSHRGLTFGGWIFESDLSFALVRECISSSLLYYSRIGIHKVWVKVIPQFLSTRDQAGYWKSCTAEGAVIVESKIFHATTLPAQVTDRGKRWGAGKAKINQVEILESNELQRFWKELLIPNLQDRHQAKPVHSLEEITLLQSKFPQNIKLWLAKKGEELLAGSLIYLQGSVVHCQYTISSHNGKVLRALDLLFVQLISEVSSDYKFVSLGTSISQKTKTLDPGLVHWKESLGATAYKVPVFEFTLTAKDN